MILILLLTLNAFGASWEKFSDYSKFSVEGRAGRHAVYLEMKTETEEFIKIKSCGGIFLDQNTLLTNAHCTPNSADTQITAHLNYGFVGARPTSIECRSVISKHIDLDYALIDCENNEKFDLVRISTRKEKLKSSIFIVHHNCHTNMECDQPKKVSKGRILKRLQHVPFIGEFEFTVDEVVHTDAFIKRGSSGSPVFNKYGQLIGIANGTADGGLKSSFIPIHLILQHMEN